MYCEGFPWSLWPCWAPRNRLEDSCDVLLSCISEIAFVCVDVQVATEQNRSKWRKSRFVSLSLTRSGPNALFWSISMTFWYDGTFLVQRYLYPTDPTYVYSLLSALAHCFLRTSKRLVKLQYFFGLVVFFRRYSMGDDITSCHYQLLTMFPQFLI